MIKNIPKDKQKHIAAGALIAILCTWIGWFLWPHQWIYSIGFGLAVCSVAGFGFELFSYVTGLGHAEWMDAIVTVAGGVIGVGISSLVFYFSGAA